jgi:predicted metallopeptidase
MNESDQDKLLIHELLHIPRTFSGALKNHKGSLHRGLVTPSVVDSYYKRLINDERVADSRRNKGRVSVDYKSVPEIKNRLDEIIRALNWTHINSDQIICFESTGSKTRSPILIGPLPLIWQQALGLKPHYIIEVLGEKFYNLSHDDRDKSLIKVLMYIPKSFSGSLNRQRISSAEINKYYQKLICQEGLSWI